MTDQPTLKISLMPDADESILPEYKHAGDAGMDLKLSEGVRLGSRIRMILPTGIKVSIPEGYVGMVCPRSGLAARQGVTVLNAPGIVDSGYRGEVGVILYNTSNDTVALSAGDRIAQLVIVPVAHPEIEVVSNLDSDTARGEGGFGSTGL